MSAGAWDFPPPPDVEAMLEVSPPAVLPVCLGEVSMKAVDWLWYPYIPKRKITFIAGDPGVGKSYVCMAIAAHLSSGAPYPILNGREPSRHPSSTILYLYAEDDPADTIRPRMESMGADLRRILISNGRTTGPSVHYLSLDRDDLLIPMIESTRPALLVFDPIESFMGKVNPNAAEDVRPRLDKLAFLAEKYDFAVVAIRFNRKASAESAIHKSAGSIAWMAAARSFLSCQPDPEQENSQYTTHGILAQVKCNLAPLGPSMRYAIREGVFGWDGMSTLTAADLLAHKAKKAPTMTSLDAGKAFLREQLANGPQISDDLFDLAKKRKVCGRNALWEAKKSLEIKAVKEEFGGRWKWSLPEESPPNRPSKHPSSGEGCEG